MSDPKPTVTFETSQGDIRIALNPDAAPKTVENFLGYVRSGHYDGTIFHRVIPGFMIQGGGFTPDMGEKAGGPQIENEAGGMNNTRGTIAMARTSAPHSATAQFFINLKDNGFLDKSQAQDGWGYCAFGEVVDGMDTVDAIAQVETGRRGPHDDVPTEPVVINNATVEE